MPPDSLSSGGMALVQIAVVNLQSALAMISAVGGLDFFDRHRVVIPERGHQIVELVGRILGEDDVAGGQHVARCQDFQSLLHAVICGGKIDIAPNRQRALLQVECDLNLRAQQ